MTRQTNNAKRIGGLVLVAAVVAVLSSTARAELIGNVEFPAGALSFADAVVSYTPVIDSPQSPNPSWRNANDALGAPNYAPPAPKASVHNTGQFVSLGNGGTLVVEFVNNRLTGSGTSADDLHIFEVGPVVEASFVWISTDNVNWLYVGRISGNARGINIDPYLVTASLPATTQFRYVAIQDDAFDSYGLNFYAGADIDAIGAISSTSTIETPEPATLALVTLGGLMILLRRNRRTISEK